MHRVGNALTRRKGVGVFGSALLRREGVRGFGFGIGCSGVIQMTRDGRRQVGIGPIGVGTVTVVTPRYIESAEVAVGGDSRLRRGGDNRHGRRQRGTYCRRQKVVVAIGRDGGL